jgi:hypothetical protein
MTRTRKTYRRTRKAVPTTVTEWWCALFIMLAALFCMIIMITGIYINSQGCKALGSASWLCEPTGIYAKGGEDFTRYELTLTANQGDKS